MAVTRCGNDAMLGIRILVALPEPGITDMGFRTHVVAVVGKILRPIPRPILLLRHRIGRMAARVEKVVQARRDEALGSAPISVQSLVPAGGASCCFCWAFMGGVMMDDYDVDYDGTCPYCNHSPIHSRSCINFCDDGFIDEHEDDPINFMPGESVRRCRECRGTGVEIWCPKCGQNLSGVEGLFNDDL